MQVGDKFVETTFLSETNLRMCMIQVKKLLFVTQGAEIGSDVRAWLRLGRKRSTGTRRGVQAWQSGQEGRKK